MALVLAFEEDVSRLICGYAPLSGRSVGEKQCFYGEWECIGQMIKVCACVTLMNMWVGILM